MAIFGALEVKNLRNTIIAWANSLMIVLILFIYECSELTVMVTIFLAIE